MWTTDVDHVGLFSSRSRRLLKLAMALRLRAACVLAVMTVVRSGAHDDMIGMLEPQHTFHIEPQHREKQDIPFWQTIGNATIMQNAVRLTLSRGQSFFLSQRIVPRRRSVR